MKQQSGMVTLLVTSMLLVGALVLSLASYKNAYFLIKRANNDILTTKAHWAAEGGLECGFVALKGTSSPEDMVSSGNFPAECQSLMDIDLSTSVSGSNYVLVSEVNDIASAILSKTITLVTNGRSGSIQTGSNMYSHSSLTFYNPDPGELVGDGWECVAVRYKGEYSPNASIVNMGLSSVTNPDPTFDNQGKDCKGSHKTNGTGQQALKSDFINDPDLSPFEDFFAVNDSEHDTVKTDKFDVVLSEVASPSGDLEYSGINHCGEAISKALANGHTKIWVEGNCELEGTAFQDLVRKSNQSDGVFLLVHDGMFSVYPEGVKDSDGNSLELKGLLFHYNFGNDYDFQDWIGSKAYSQLNHTPSVFGDAVKTASFYLHGALNIEGGVLLDAKHLDSTSGKYALQNALLNDSFAMTYNGEYFKKFGSDSTTVNWVQGSWHDF